MILALYSVVVIATTVVILVSANVAGESGLLRQFTRENGIVESASALALLLVAVMAAVALRRDSQSRARGEGGFAETAGNLPRRLLWLLFAAGLLAGLEEISWGQQIFGFRSGEFFRTHNLQRETNLHNLLPASVSSSILNGVVYALFLWLPCWLRLAPRGRLAGLVRTQRLDLFLPATTTMLIFAWGSTLQAYFIWMTWSDTAALVVTLILLAAALRRSPAPTRSELFHFGWVVASAVVFALHHAVFRFANMQYEIRELVVVLGCLHWMAGWAFPRAAQAAATAPGAGSQTRNVAP